MSLLAWYHLVAFGLFIPILAILSKRRMAVSPLPSRRRHFLTASATLILFGAFSAYVARAVGIELFPAALPHLSGVVAGAVMLVVCVAAMRPSWRRTVEKRERIAYLFMPRDTTERMLWLLLSLAAGVTEEITWRGVQPALLTYLIGRPLLAAAIVAATFGVAHMIQGWRSVAIVALFGAAFQGVVWLSGSLYVAMATHVLYDATAGLTYGKLGEELGYPVAAAITNSPGT